MEENKNAKMSESDRIKLAEETMEKASKGKFTLKVPIMDGEKKHDVLLYDFNQLTGWEIARAIDSGESRNSGSNTLTNTQALAVFSAAAAKCTDGLDATDIKERLSAFDVSAAINIASVFFRFTLLSGSMRITSA